MRRPVVSYALAILTLLGIPCASQAQGSSYDPAPFVPRLDLSLGYNFIHANAPPGGPSKFNLSGAYASVGYTYKYWLSFAGEATGAHANQISTLGQNLTLTTYTAGPRVVLRAPRISPYAQALFGLAHGSDSYFPTATSYTTSANSFAFTVGGGLDYNISHRFAARAEAQYLHTAFNNGVNTSQNQLMVGVGVVMKFHGYFATPHTHHKEVRPAPQADTSVAPEPAAAVATPVPAAPAPPPPTDPVSPPVEPVAAASPTSDHQGARVHLADIYFDYDKADLRSDARTTLQAVATYLHDHADEHLRIAGYSDERGTPQYNLSLGEKRANAVRDELVKAGVDADRVAVVSYGNAVQVCTKPAEPCYQRNRRVEFTPQN